MGASTDSVRGGVNALQRIKETHGTDLAYDLVFLDYPLVDMDVGEFLSTLAQRHPNKTPKTIALTLPGQRAGIPEGEFSFVAETLSKPMKRREFYSAVSSALQMGRSAPLPAPRTKKPAAIKQRFDAKVLLVEDNEMNQLVAGRHLSILGCNVTIAENGLEALAALENDTCRAHCPKKCRA